MKIQVFMKMIVKMNVKIVIVTVLNVTMVPNIVAQNVMV